MMPFQSETNNGTQNTGLKKKLSNSQKATLVFFTVLLAVFLIIIIIYIVLSSRIGVEKINKLILLSNGSERLLATQEPFSNGTIDEFIINVTSQYSVNSPQPPLITQHPDSTISDSVEEVSSDSSVVTSQKPLTTQQPFTFGTIGDVIVNVSSDSSAVTSQKLLATQEPVTDDTISDYVVDISSDSSVGISQNPLTTKELFANGTIADFFVNFLSDSSVLTSQKPLATQPSFTNGTIGDFTVNVTSQYAVVTSQQPLTPQQPVTSSTISDSVEEVSSDSSVVTSQLPVTSNTISDYVEEFSSDSSVVTSQQPVTSNTISDYFEEFSSDSSVVTSQQPVTSGTISNSVEEVSSESSVVTSQQPLTPQQPVTSGTISDSVEEVSSDSSVITSQSPLATVHPPSDDTDSNDFTQISSDSLDISSVTDEYAETVTSTQRSTVISQEEHNAFKYSTYSSEFESPAELCILNNGVSLTDEVQKCLSGNDSDCYSKTAELLMSRSIDGICRIRAQDYFYKNIKVDGWKSIFLPYTFFGDISVTEYIEMVGKHMLKNNTGENACVLTNDEKSLNYASAVVFQKLDGADLEKWNSLRSRNNQVWILNLPMPPKSYEKDNVEAGRKYSFNWTATYTLSSNVPFLEKIPNHQSNIYEIREKKWNKKLSVAIFDHTCSEEIKNFLKILENNSVEVHDFSNCKYTEKDNEKIIKSVDDIEKQMEANRYTFVFYLPNRICPEYVELMFYRIIRAESIALVKDGDEEIYKKVAPPDSFYFLKGLKENNAKELLNYFHESKDKYYAINKTKKYKRKKKQKLFEDAYFFARLCALLHANPKGVKEINIYDWITTNLGKCH